MGPMNTRMSRLDVIGLAAVAVFTWAAISFAGQQPPDVWKVSTLAPVSNVGQPGEPIQYYSLATTGAQQLVIMGDQAHPLIRFLEARRGTMVTVTITGGTPE